MTPTRVLFDMDGVLVDSRPALIASYKQTCFDLNIPSKTQEFALALGATLEEIFLHLHPLYPAELAAAHFRGVSGNFSSEEFGGAREFIDLLIRLGISVDIVTNKDFPRATKIAEELRFSVGKIWSPSNGYKPKPDPEMLLQAFGDYSASQVLFVGDTKTDFLAALGAGCPFVHATWGYEPSLALPLGFRGATSFSHLREIIF